MRNTVTYKGVEFKCTTKSEVVEYGTYKGRTQLWVHWETDDDRYVCAGYISRGYVGEEKSELDVVKGHVDYIDSCIEEAKARRERERKSVELDDNGIYPEYVFASHGVCSTITVKRIRFEGRKKMVEFSKHVIGPNVETTLHAATSLREFKKIVKTGYKGRYKS